MEESAIATAIFVFLRILEQVLKKWRESRVTRANSIDGPQGKKGEQIGRCVAESDCERRRNDEFDRLDKIKAELKADIKTNRDELASFKASVDHTFEDMYHHGRDIGHDVKFVMGVISQFNEDRRHGKD